jgi:hypothetical protein
MLQLRVLDARANAACDSGYIEVSLSWTAAAKLDVLEHALSAFFRMSSTIS